MRAFLVAAQVSLAVSLAAGVARGQITVVGADGSDGAFSPASNIQVPLGNAVPGVWDAPSTSAGSGVYDAEQWAVVYKYTSVNIPANVTVTFANHPSRAPVVWLVSGDVTINGLVSVNGSNGMQGSNPPFLPTEPGPGGFRGAQRCTWSPVTPGSGGFGPGGGTSAANCTIASSGGGHTTSGTGSDPTATYGTATIQKLLGGSGGGRWFSNGFNTIGGGAGGGAILIACTGTVTVNGTVSANGGGGALGGAGGAVKIVAFQINGPSATVQAVGGTQAGTGRIRFEGGSTAPITNTQPTASAGAAPAGAFRAFPAATSNPSSIRIVNIGDTAVSSNPLANVGFPTTDVLLPRPGSFVVRMVVKNMNPAALEVKARVVPLSGAPSTVTAEFISGTTTESLWQATVPFALRLTNVLQGTAAVIVGQSVQPPSAISREVSAFAQFCSADLDDDGNFANGGNPDDAVTIDDLLFFLVAFEAGAITADLDNDGLDPGAPDGGVTIDDLLFFLAHFEAGC